LKNREPQTKKRGYLHQTRPNSRP